MAFLVAASASLGLVIFILGLPPLRQDAFSERITPYLVHDMDPWRRRRSFSKSKSFALRTAEFLGAGSTARLTERLDAARSSVDPAGFRLRQFLSGMLTAFAVTSLFGLSALAGARPEPAAAIMLSFISFSFGAAVQDWLLGRAVAKRKSRLSEELPVAIDLMMLTLMSGGSVPVACERVARALSGGVGRELGDAIDAMRAGSPAVEALRSLSDRLQHREMARFLNSLCLGIERGTPLGDVLRIQAEAVRDTRRRGLIESGGRREVLMLVPVVFLILPSVILFALYPAMRSLDLLVP